MSQEEKVPETTDDYLYEVGAGRDRYYEVWNDDGELVLATRDYAAAHEAASVCLWLAQG